MTMILNGYREREERSRQLWSSTTRALISTNKRDQVKKHLSYLAMLAADHEVVTRMWITKFHKLDSARYLEYKNQPGRVAKLLQKAANLFEGRHGNPVNFLWAAGLEYSWRATLHSRQPNRPLIISMQQIKLLKKFVEEAHAS